MADIKSHSTLTTGLVSYWDLEEASGTRYDLHGSNNLTDNNTVTQAAGKIGNSALFTAANSEYLSITDASQTGLELGASFSLSCWVYLTSAPATNGVMNFIAKDGNNTNRSWAFYYRDVSGTKKLTLFVDKVGTVNASDYDFYDYTTTLSTATWYHLGVTWNGSTKTTNFYINGSNVSSPTGTNVASVFNGNADFSIGSSNGGGSWSGFTDGRVEEVGVWSKVLTSGEITDLYNSGNGLPYYDPTDIKNNTTLTTSLVSYWKLDETSGTRNDSHGTNHLTDNNTVLYGTGKIGNGADFESTNSEYLNIADASQSGLDFTSDFSFSCWLNLESQPATNDGMALMYKWGASQAAYGLTYSDFSGVKKLRFNGYTTGGGSNYAFDFTQTLSNATWYHIVMRYKASTTQVEMFVNGVSIGTVTNASYTGSSNTTGAFSLSSLGSGVQWYLDGLLDETCIWGKWISVAEVRALYGYGTPPEYEVVAASTFIPRVSFIM